MAVQYDVPLVKQQKTMSCWYAASCMLAWFYEAGPRYGMPTVWKNNTGLAWEQWPKLAANEGFKEVIWPASKTWSAETMKVKLLAVGPILCHGAFYHSGHAIVLTGIDGETLSLNDPWEPQKKTCTLAWFNEKVWGAQWKPMWHYKRDHGE